MSYSWIDLSHPLTEETPPFPGDPSVEITILDSTDESGYHPRQNMNCSRFAMCVHCGTHMDAPYHFFGNGLTIEQIDMDACCGDTCLVSLEDQTRGIRGAVIDRELLQGREEAIRDAQRVVIRTGWDRQWRHDGYFTDHPVLTRAAARFLVDCGVRLVGVDFPSVDRPPHEAHLELLGAGLVIVENLTALDQIHGERFELLAIPLALVGRDGSPVRALARVRH